MANTHTIIVGVNNTAASMEALSLACIAGRGQRSKIFVIHVLEVRRSLPVNADLDTEARQGEQILRKAEEVAAKAGATVQAELLQAREAGQALVDEALAREADALAVGISLSPVLGHFRLGSTATFALQRAPCDVWLIRQGTQKRHQHAEEVASG